MRKKIGYSKARTKILKKGTPIVKKYIKKGYSPKKAIRTANIEASRLSGIHKDTKSHNVKINVLSGINVNSALNKLYKDYGIVHSQLLQTSSKGQKKILKGLLKDIKIEINKVKKLK